MEGLINGGTKNFAPVLEKLLNESMKIEWEKCIGAQPFECTNRKGYSNGFKDKTLQTRSGPLQLKIPQVRNLEFYPACLEKGCRSEKALKVAINEKGKREVLGISMSLSEAEIH